MKTNKKDKPRVKSKKRLLIAGGALLVLLLIAFLARGWIRMTVIPKTIQAVHGNPGQKVYKDEIDVKLRDPLATLGFPSTQPEKSQCFTAFANSISTEVICTHQVDSSYEIPQDEQSKAALNVSAEELQSLLSSNGWQGEYSEVGTYTSLKKLASSITAGIDYQPDASYMKKVGDVECLFSVRTAFSVPDPPAIAAQAYCTRTFDVLGKPEIN